MTRTATSPASSQDQFRRLFVLIAVACLDLMGFGMIFPLMPFYALHLNASPTTIGFIIASFSVAQLMSAPIWGRVSDRYGRRPALLIGLSASAVAFVIFGFANTIGLLFLSRIVQGAGGGTTGVVQAYVSDAVDAKDRARALGWLSAGTNLGTMLGPALGSFASQWGQHAPGLIAASLCVVNGLFAYFWLPESRKFTEHDRKKERKPIWGAAWNVVRHPRREVSRLIWIYAVGMLAFSAFTSVLALYLGSEFGITERTIGLVFFYVGLFSVVMRSALIGPIVDRIGELWCMRIGSACVVLGFLGYTVATSLWTLALVVPLIPIGTALLFPATTALMSKYSDKAELGTTMGIAQTFAGFARVTAPPLSTKLFSIGHTLPFFFSAAFLALVSLLAFRVKTHKQPAAST